MPLALIPRAHTNAHVIPHTLGMVLNAKVRLFCHKLFNLSTQYWIKSNLLLLSWPLSSNSNSDPAELIWISIMTVLASSRDILHIGYLISFYRCITIVLVHDKFNLSLTLARCQKYKILEKTLNH